MFPIIWILFQTVLWVFHNRNVLMYRFYNVSPQEFLWSCFLSPKSIKIRFCKTFFFQLQFFIFPSYQRIRPYWLIVTKSILDIWDFGISMCLAFCLSSATHWPSGIYNQTFHSSFHWRSNGWQVGLMMVLIILQLKTHLVTARMIVSKYMMLSIGH